MLHTNTRDTTEISEIFVKKKTGDFYTLTYVTSAALQASVLLLLLLYVYLFVHLYLYLCLYCKNVVLNAGTCNGVPVAATGGEGVRLLGSG